MTPTKNGTPVRARVGGKLDEETLAIATRDDAPPAKPGVDVRLLRELAGEILAQSKVPTLDYGINGLNDKAPLPMRAMASLVGPTGAGKTSLAATIGAHHCRFTGAPGPSQGPTVHLLFELTGPQLAARRVSQMAPYSWRQVLGGALSVAEIESILTGEHYYVVKVGRGVKYLDAAIGALDEAQRRSPGTPMLIVDYLQRIKGAGHDLRHSTATVVDDFVDLTESRDMFTLMLSKGSRGGSRAMRDGKSRGEALVDAAAETSAIEAGSAVQIAITYETREGDDAGPLDARLEVTKARYGMTGAAVGMRFHGASGRWVELDDVPLTKGEREASERVLEAAAKADGFDSANALNRAAGGNKQGNLAAIRRELKAGGLVLSGGRIVAGRGAS